MIQKSKCGRALRPFPCFINGFRMIIKSVGIRRRLQYAALVVCSTTLSCHSPEIHHISFGESYQIEGESIRLTNLDNPGALLATESYIIVLQYGGEYFLRVYDIHDHRELGQLARKGSRPDEFPTSLILDHCVPCGNSECIWVHDLNKGELIKINIAESLDKLSLAIVQRVQTRPESRFHTAFVVDSTLVVGRSTNSTPQMNRLQIYDPSSDNIVKTVALFPKIDRPSNDLEFVTSKYNMLYVASLGLKPDNTQVASAMCSFDRIDIFNVDGEIKVSVYDGREIPVSSTEYLEEENADQLRMYYGDIFTSNSYIYALYYGQPFSEFGRMPVPTEIRIFDWLGEPRAKIKVGEYLHSISVDEGKGVIYGLDVLEKRVLRYDIKPILDEL